MAKLTIFRGLPGAGKSTAARKLGCLIVEPDMWHTKNGIYSWDRDTAPTAHRAARRVVEYALILGFDVAVAETLPSLARVQEIVDIGMKADAEVVVVDLVVDAPTSYARNTHKVPLDDIKRMEDAWEPWVEPEDK